MASATTTSGPSRRPQARVLNLILRREEPEGSFDRLSLAVAVHAGGTFQRTFVLDWQQSGSNLSGTIKLSSESGTDEVNGTVNGGMISFGTVGSQAITYSGSVCGDSMSGAYKVQTPNGSVGGSWSATKGS
jgi:hypothetical protein